MLRFDAYFKRYSSVTEYCVVVSRNIENNNANTRNIVNNIAVALNIVNINGECKEYCTQYIIVTEYCQTISQCHGMLLKYSNATEYRRQYSSATEYCRCNIAMTRNIVKKVHN